MNGRDNDIGRLTKKQCTCEGEEIRILLESITICPTCLSLYSTLVYRVPQEHLEEILQKVDEVMSSYGIQCEGRPLPRRSAAKRGDLSRHSPA